MISHKIDVALTYASEQREYVEAVDKYLKNMGIKSWFLPFEKVELWGEDLISYLQRIYRDDATLCVMFISKEYVSKAWPAAERSNALQRQVLENNQYILPVRFDDTPVPGLNETIYYLLAKDYKPEELADAVNKKLQKALSIKK